MSLTEEQEKTPLLAIPKLLRTKLLEIRDSNYSEKWEKEACKKGLILVQKLDNILSEFYYQ